MGYIHGTVKIVSMDCGLCAAVGILHLNKHSVYGQSLMKKRKYWPKGCPGAQIDSYMEDKPLGFVKTLRQDMGGIHFNINCTIYGRFFTSEDEIVVMAVVAARQDP